MEELRKLHAFLEQQILDKLKGFREKQGDYDAILKELLFCILTPQSKAETCWNAVESLYPRVIHNSDVTEKDIIPFLRGVRFKNNKARYIIGVLHNRDYIINIINEKKDDPRALREWLVRNIKGIGMKEASHFLRNIGIGDDIAILDRHILSCLREAGIIHSIPKSLNKSQYQDIEGKMRYFSKRVNIPMSHLDFVFWYKRTGRVFK